VAGFGAAEGGGVTARFATGEALLLRSLVSQVAELVAKDLGDIGPADDDLEAMLGPSGGIEPPDDAVLARLLPDAYRDDPDAAGEFRKYTEHSLRSGKVESAQTVLATLPEAGGRVRLSADEAQAWLRAINDVRLALGVRLGVTEDFEEQLEGVDAGDPRSAAFEVYDWLTALQDTLVRVLS